jgi:hypothetical protein
VDSSQVGFRHIPRSCARAYPSGALPPLMSVTLVRMTSFTVYQSSKYFLSDSIERATGEAPLEVVNTPGRMPNLSTVFCFTTAGVIAGIATTPIACMIPSS